MTTTGFSLMVLVEKATFENSGRYTCEAELSNGTVLEKEAGFLNVYREKMGGRGGGKEGRREASRQAEI